MRIVAKNTTTTHFTHPHQNGQITDHMRFTIETNARQEYRAEWAIRCLVILACDLTFLLGFRDNQKASRVSPNKTGGCEAMQNNATILCPSDSIDATEYLNKQKYITHRTNRQRQDTTIGNQATTVRT